MEAIFLLHSWVDYFTGKGKEPNIRMFKVAERDLVISCFIHSMQPEIGNGYLLLKQRGYLMHPLIQMKMRSNTGIYQRHLCVPACHTAILLV